MLYCSGFRGHHQIFMHLGQQGFFKLRYRNAIPELIRNLLWAHVVLPCPAIFLQSTYFLGCRKLLFLPDKPSIFLCYTQGDLKSINPDLRTPTSSGYSQLQTVKKDCQKWFNLALDVSSWLAVSPLWTLSLCLIKQSCFLTLQPCQGLKIQKGASFPWQQPANIVHSYTQSLKPGKATLVISLHKNIWGGLLFHK